MKAGKAALIVVVALIGALASDMSIARGKGSRGGTSGSHHSAVQGSGGRFVGALHHFRHSRWAVSDEPWTRAENDSAN